MTNIWYIYAIGIILCLMIFQVCQMESFDNYVIETFEVPPPPPELSELEPKRSKDELLGNIADKLAVVNRKINKFDDTKPVKAQVYRDLFEKQLPRYFETERGGASTGRHIFDISQRQQDNNIQKLETNIGKLVQDYDVTMSSSSDQTIKSVKSHLSGKNLNLLNQGQYHSIPLNNGCLFVINNEDGDVDYDITNIMRTDKNQICMDDNKDQQFTLNKIDNLDGYQTMVGSQVANGPMDENISNYPFYVLKPRNFDKFCLQTNSEGVHIEPCNYSKAQRWAGYKFRRPC
jgi:hypothetical protein